MGYLECWLGRSWSSSCWLLDEDRDADADELGRWDVMLGLAGLFFHCCSRPFLLPSTSVLAFVGSDRRTAWLLI